MAEGKQHAIGIGVTKMSTIDMYVRKLLSVQCFMGDSIFPFTKTRVERTPVTFRVIDFCDRQRVDCLQSYSRDEWLN